MEERDNLEIIKEVDGALQNLRTAFLDAVNGLESPETIIKAIEQWKEGRQPLNNRGVGILVGISKFRIVTFPITNKNTVTEQHIDPNFAKQFDENFMKDCKILSEEREEKT